MTQISKFLIPACNFRMAINKKKSFENSGLKGLKEYFIFFIFYMETCYFFNPFCIFFLANKFAGNGKQLVEISKCHQAQRFFNINIYFFYVTGWLLGEKLHKSTVYDTNKQIWQFLAVYTTHKGQRRRLVTWTQTTMLTTVSNDENWITNTRWLVR